MISVIVCSHKKKVLATLAENIAQTIGLPYEIIAVENPTGSFGLCEAYNLGAAKASFDILCFMHEDISFETQGWGHRVTQHLADRTTGLIGVAGGSTKSMIPGSWPSYIAENEIHLVQHYKKGGKPPEKFLQTGASKLGEPVKVACVDGVWMCTRKDVFTQCQFDDIFFKGFHGYDIDFSLQVNQTYHVYVVFDILLHHYSEGSFNREWLAENIRLARKWKKLLPFSVNKTSRRELVRQHWTCMNIFIEQMTSLNCSTRYIIKHFLEFAFNRLFHFRHFMYSCKNIYLRQILKRDVLPREDNRKINLSGH